MNEETDLDKAKVLKVLAPKRGGLYTCLKGHKYPFPGFPMERIVDEIAMVKRSIITIFNVLYPRKILFLIRNIFRIISAYYPVLKCYSRQINPDRYSHSVRELHRILSIGIESEKSEEMKGKIRMLRDLICLILEFDNAYRFRFQYLLGRMDIQKVKLDEIDQYYCSLRKDYDFNLETSELETKSLKVGPEELGNVIGPYNNDYPVIGQEDKKNV